MTRWIEVRQDEVVRPDGSVGYYDHVVLPGSVTVLAVDGGGLVAVTSQWIYTHGGFQWRLPGGAIDAGDQGPEDAARRELAEETGATARTWELLGVVHGADSATNHRDHVFRASGLIHGPAHLEPTEADLEVSWLPFEEAVAMVLRGEIHHAGSTFALLAAAAGA
ncbi:NUDIX hydrolase [Kitasatospora atroaurantiaca]